MADILLHLLARFVHIASVVLLVGGVAHARAANPLESMTDSLPVRRNSYRNALFTLLLLIVASGLYNFLTGVQHTSTYQMWFGFKMLAVAHIAGTAILWAVSPGAGATGTSKSKRRLLSLTVSGLIAILISNYLRSMSLRGL